MVDKPLRSAASVFYDARQLLRMTQRELGEAVGGSQRSAVRWEAEQAVPSQQQSIKLAALIAPLDLALAGEAAAHAGTTLEALGLAPPALPPRPPPPPRAVAPEHLVDAVVCAVAELMDTSPRPLRPLLYAAFKKAREVGLTVEAAEKALAPSAAPAPPPAPADAPRDEAAKEDGLR